MDMSLEFIMERLVRIGLEVFGTLDCDMSVLPTYRGARRFEFQSEVSVTAGNLLVGMAVAVEFEYAHPNQTKSAGMQWASINGEGGDDVKPESQ